MLFGIFAGKIAKILFLQKVVKYDFYDHKYVRSFLHENFNEKI